MSLIKLTENLENFKWTEYEKAGEGRSPQLDGTDYFERPSQKALEDMESKFGILDTPPGVKGSYGDMKVVDIRTLMNPLAYNIAGVNSDLVYGVVPKQTINFSPSAEGAWGDPLSFLPISTYSSVIPNQLDIEQKTFNIPDSYPNNNSSYSINTQYGWSWENEYLGIHGMPWRGFKLTTTAQDQMDTAGLADVVPDWYPSPPTQVSHPVQHIYMNSEPGYGAPSWLETQFLINYGVTDGIWPYKVLDYEGTHPLIRKEVGQRFEIGTGVNWMAVQAMRTGDDISRIEKWMETPAGEQWQITQNMLQDLNPREETRLWNRDSIALSIPPLLHAKRHFIGETYMDVADFGPLFSADEPSGITLGGLLGAKFPKLSGKLKTASEKYDSFMEGLDKLNSFLGDVDFNAEGAGGRLRFLRNRFIIGDRDKDSSINLGGLGDISLTALRNKSSPFGRPPKIPTQTTFSQRGAYGQGSIHQQTAETGIGGNQIQRYKALAYGELGSKYSKFDSPFLGRNRAPGGMDMGDIEDAFAENVESDPFSLTDDQFNGLVSDFVKDINLFEKEKGEVEDINKATAEYKKRVGEAGRVHHNVGHQGKQRNLVQVTDTEEEGSGLGIIKKNVGFNNATGEGYKSIATDKINMHPYGKDLPEGVSDFVKFKFKDLINDKFIIFRAILSGISDSITPEWTGTRYIGRPDQVYVYTGTERKISFNFEIYPKTKQEFPVLMEKLNYLVGLCYPSFTGGNRMVAPFIQLTLGDMFKDTPGFLDSLSVDVDDNSTWEINEGLQFPKHITCNCSFTYVGKYMPSTLGKHYELPWLTDNGWSAGNEVGKGATYGTFIASEKTKGGEGEDKDTFPIKDNPERGLPMGNLFDKLG